jgi:hypothetical protein
LVFLLVPGQSFKEKALMFLNDTHIVGLSPETH